ncbi:hypothetical protein D7X96_29210 [Corallococcus interemptor]|uniref:Uncharacterized protein n=1 Tax=Corallococcus interemptor TaxID=2316720 RepID=A0A3A8QHR2_9BACT|nr:hypothetical protein D7X96_29210 [Corallococcus interemptor]
MLTALVSGAAVTAVRSLSLNAGGVVSLTPSATVHQPSSGARQTSSEPSSESCVMASQDASGAAMPGAQTASGYWYP